MGRSRQTRSGVTWIDLVVVLGVGVLLVPLVVPVLRDAGEQARVGQCLANLGALMTATGAYLGDCGNLPLCGPRQVDPETGQITAICTWAYGGATDDSPDDHYWVTSFSGTFFIPAGERPINPYLLGAPVQPDLYTGTQLLRNTPIPRLRCPSDRYTHQRGGWGGAGWAAEPISCYNDVGTSYLYNLHALSPESRSGVGGSGLIFNGVLDDNMWQPPGTWTVYGKILLDQVLARHSASFALFLEDPMDYALNQATLEVGNHGERGKHSLGYLDGHADYVFRDTRNWCGVGWEAINPDWVWNTSYPEPPRPVSYPEPYISCHPRQGTTLGE